MTKQGEIRDILITLCCEAHAKDLSKSPSGFDGEVNGALQELSDVGLVIKVERKHDSDCSVHNMPACPTGPCDCIVLPVGCVAVEPLILKPVDQ